jgi:pantoate--beta-alanine ligase
MKLIRKISDLNKAVNNEKDLGFVPTMGCIHKGHEFLIKTSKKKCKKTLVSIFVNPTQFNNKKDYKTYPRNIIKDLSVLKKLKVDFVYLPTVAQIYRKKRLSKIKIIKSQKIMCAKFRKGHFEGVLDVLDRFINLISPKIMFMGKKDFQQYILVKNFITKKYKTKVYACKTIRNSNSVALSSRNILLDHIDIKKAGLIVKRLVELKRSIKKITLYKVDLKKLNQIINKEKQNIINLFNIDIEYLECRNIINLGKNFDNKSLKIFIAYYFGSIRLIDNF